MYKKKSIKSGDMLEIEIFPARNGGIPRNRAGGTSESQKRLNKKNTIKKVIRLLNANFTDEDNWITVGYNASTNPDNLDRVKKDIVNYLRRLKNYMHKYYGKNLKYLYTIEQAQSGMWHAHIVSNFPERDIAEKKWRFGKYPQSRRLKPDDYGLEGLARYIIKDGDFNKDNKSKRYGYSKGLIKSWLKATVNNYEITDRKVTKFETGRLDPKEYFEKKHKGYRFLSFEIYDPPDEDRFNSVYIYVRMTKRKETKHENR